jgi:hypothetical protein
MAARWNRALDRRGQTTSEYVVIAGIVVAIAVVVADGLGLSLRLAMQAAVQRVIGVVTGYP